MRCVSRYRVRYECDDMIRFWLVLVIEMECTWVQATRFVSLTGHFFLSGVGRSPSTRLARTRSLVASNGCTSSAAASSAPSQHSSPPQHAAAL